MQLICYCLCFCSRTHVHTNLLVLQRTQGVAFGAIALMTVVVLGSVYIMRKRTDAKYNRVQNGYQRAGDGADTSGDVALQGSTPPPGRRSVLAFKQYEDDDPMVEL
jgi:hypothetical protein